MKWRDHLALWCLRRLTPRGICAENVPIAVYFHSGRSTPADPKLVMDVRLLGKEQTIIALVLNPDRIVDLLDEKVRELREWADNAGATS